MIGYNTPCMVTWFGKMDSEFKQKIHESRKLLGNPYAYVAGDGTFEAVPNKSPSAPRHAVKPWRDEPVIDLRSIRRKGAEVGRSRSDIETIARDFLERLWRSRQSVFQDGKSVAPIMVLDPFVALRAIGYRVELVESLGQHLLEGQLVEVAGTIERCERTIQISRQFPLPVRKFTAAHELGHALLHDGVGLHRDRALDGTEGGIRRNRTEREADAFATYFLMPEKQIRVEFGRRFKAPVFVQNEETVFALTAWDLSKFQATYNNARKLSKLLARATRYDGVQFHSLAAQFGVSDEAMSIRLEELSIVRE